MALSNINVDIRERDAVLVLSVNADLSSPVNSALRVVTESAIREQVGATFDDWRGQGSVKGELALAIPLTAGLTPDVSVDTYLNISELELGSLNLSLAKVQGGLRFDSDSGINAPKLSAELFGKPVAAYVRQEPGKPVLVNARGRMDIADIQAWLKQPLLGFARGEADFNLDISAGTERTHLRASSDLFGIAIELPGSLGKKLMKSHWGAAKVGRTPTPSRPPCPCAKTPGGPRTASCRPSSCTTFKTPSRSVTR